MVRKPATLDNSLGAIERDLEVLRRDGVVAMDTIDSVLLGELARGRMTRKTASISEQLALVTPGLEEYRAPTTDMETLLTRCVIFRVQLGRWGTTKKLPQGTISAQDANPKWVKAQKALIADCPEYDAIVKLQNQIRGAGSYLESVSLPSPFGSGSYAVPIGLVGGVNDKFLEYDAALEVLVDAFMGVYSDARGRAQEQLGSVFNRNDYPSAERVKAAFSFKWNFVTLATPETLPAEILAQERAKIAVQCVEWKDEIRDALRVSLQDMVTHMVDKLAVGGDGKPKVFRDRGGINKLTAFLDTFGDRNITNDGQLQALVNSAREIMNGLKSVDDLRKDADVKAAVAAGFAEIKASLDLMVEDRPMRKVRVRSTEIGVSE